MTSILRIASALMAPFKGKKSPDGIPYASFSSRYGSIMFDMFCIFVLLQGVTWVYLQAFGQYIAPLEVIEKFRMNLSMTIEEQAQIKTQAKVLWIMQIIEVIAVYLYHLFFWTKFGGTPIKLFMGLRIVDSESLKFLGPRQATKRFLACCVSLLPFGIGVAWGIFTKNTQLLHDKISKTVVLTKSHMVGASDPFDDLLSETKSFILWLVRCALESGRIFAKKTSMLLSKYHLFKK